MKIKLITYLKRNTGIFLFSKKLIFIYFLLISSFGFGQVQELVDSLKQTVKLKQGEEKALVLSDLCWYNRAISTDSAQKYGRLALNFASKIQYDKGIAQAYNDLGIISIDIADYNKA